MAAHTADFYIIRVQGHLDVTWSSTLLNMVISPNDDGTTELTGQLADQSALLGCLFRLSSLGAKLLYVEKQTVTNDNWGYA